MNNAQLKEICEFLYGERWQSALARDLNISDRTVRGWVSETWRMPDRIDQEVYALFFAKMRYGELLRRKL